MIKLFLFDIEGTTTDISFVHKVLFPYSLASMEHYLLHHQTLPSVSKALEDVRKTVWEEEQKQLGLYEVIEKLKEWITTDRKHPALKEIQGLIWDVGYAKGEFQGHLYSDVKPFFAKILSTKTVIGIYSSGSVHAQKLIFGYSTEGDLTPMISYYFDTKVGGKRDMASYERIAKETNLAPQEIHFFSDIPEELMAAKAAGMGVTQLLREGTKSSNFEGITSFESFMDVI
jgi:enolase-phosphatase E1